MEPGKRPLTDPGTRFRPGCGCLSSAPWLVCDVINVSFALCTYLPS